MKDSDQDSQILTPVVLIEKPFCVTSQQGVQLDELAEKNGLVLSVYQNRRWDSDFLTVRELINAGKVSRSPWEAVLMKCSSETSSTSNQATTDTGPWLQDRRSRRAGRLHQDKTTTSSTT